MTERPDTDPGVRGDRDATTLEPDPTAPRDEVVETPDDSTPDRQEWQPTDAPDASKGDW